MRKRIVILSMLGAVSVSTMVAQSWTTNTYGLYVTPQTSVNANVGMRTKPAKDAKLHIKTNRHLPGIPSASELEAQGVSVSVMCSLLLEKVEELTLHLIQLEKENREMKEFVYSSEK